MALDLNALSQTQAAHTCFPQPPKAASEKKAL